MQSFPSPRKNASKGKEKAVESDFDDLNPIITYRHILSQSLGVRDPLRVIALCDNDAFYAACEMVRLGIDKDKPVVVLQWDSLIAVNYPARTFGISRMDKLKDARKRCPELVVVHVATYKEGEKEPGYWDDIDTQTHKVSLDFYRRESVKIFNMFKNGLPGAEIEKASIDEEFIDFTRPVREILLKRYPYLATVPPDAPNGLDTPLPPPPSISWDGLGTLVPIKPESEASTSKPDDDVDESTTWHDVALSIAAELMGKIRDEVHTTLGYSTSAGIARNKFLAKLSASYKKPTNQSILRNAAIPNYLKPMGFQKIRFLGGKFGDALAKEYDVSTVGDLLSISLDELQQKFGENAIWVYEVLRGIDRSEVKEKSAVNKSMLASKNLQKPITKASEGQHWIRVLAAELALRLNEARKLDPTLWPKTIVLHARQGYETARSRQSAFPFTREVTVDTIVSAGNRLWKELVGSGAGMPTKVTNVQLAFTGLEAGESGQRSLEGFLNTGGLPKQQVNSKRPRADDLIEGITKIGPSDDRSTSRSIDGGAVSRKTDLENPDPRSTSNETGQASCICPRCGKHLQTQAVTSSEAELALEMMRVEHGDYHFAQDLAKEQRSVSPPRKKKKTKQVESKGIEKFFIRK